MDMEGKEQDVGQLFQQAKMLSGLMGGFDLGGGQLAGEEQGGLLGSLDKVMQLMQVMGMFTGSSDLGAAPYEPEDEYAALALADRVASPASESSVDYAKLFDEEVSTPSINAMKSALPFVDPSLHRSLGLWIKLMEMQRVFDLTNNGEPLVATERGSGDWRREMLKAMRPYASAEKRGIIDFIDRMLNLMDTMHY
jgi:hypothetical protein